MFKEVADDAIGTTRSLTVEPADDAITIATGFVQVIGELLEVDAS